MPTNARQRLLDAAEKLFYNEGIHAVGLERLLTESGVGRASFYRHFASKDDLVVSMLRNYDEAYRTWLAERTAALGGTPLAAFDALIEYAETSDFRGCAFINAIAEVAEPDSQIRTMTSQHKEAVAEYLRTLLVDAGYPDDTDLARQLLLLMDGAAVTELYERSDRAAKQAKAMARAILAQDTPSGA
ncbi:TetR/AcrR family transcriptional regulator [Nocardiopsis oceani]